MEEALGVTGQQRLVIRMIGRFPGVTAGGLARLLHLHPSTVTGLLKRLERRGMISRQADARDRRLAAFRLSPQGRRLDARRSETVESLMSNVLASLPAPRVKAARDVVRALADRFIQWSERNDEETSRRPHAARRSLGRRR
jgi:DNA-binding MarR family transcriptional regulator